MLAVVGAVTTGAVAIVLRPVGDRSVTAALPAPLVGASAAGALAASTSALAVGWLAVAAVEAGATGRKTPSAGPVEAAGAAADAEPPA